MRGKTGEVRIRCGIEEPSETAPTFLMNAVDAGNVGSGHMSRECPYIFRRGKRRPPEQGWEPMEVNTTRIWKRPSSQGRR